MRMAEVSRLETPGAVPEGSRWQVLVMEYEMLDSYWIHLHQRIWLSALVLIPATIIGLPVLSNAKLVGTLTPPVVTFVTVMALLVTVLWWLLVRRMLGYMRVSEYRKMEIEQGLGMRMEMYMSILRNSRQARKAREMTEHISEEDAVLADDLDRFVNSSAVRALTPMLPGERVVWNLLPMLLIAAWAVFSFITV